METFTINLVFKLPSLSGLVEVVAVYWTVSLYLVLLFLMRNIAKRPINWQRSMTKISFRKLVLATAFVAMFWPWYVVKGFIDEAMERL